MSFIKNKVRSVLLNVLKKHTVFHRSVANEPFVKGSALYVTGDKAKAQFSLLSPYLDFSHRFQDIEMLDINLKMRGNVLDVKDLAKSWFILNEIKEEKKKLEAERLKVAEAMKQLIKEKSNKNGDELKKIGKHLREQLKRVTQTIWNLEEKVVLTSLQLPNVLSSTTGHSNKIIFSHFPEPTFDFKPRCHVELGSLNKELIFLDNSPTAYYFKNRLAAMELAVGDFFVSKLLSQDFNLQLNPDFSKAVIVEGCGMRFTDTHKHFRLELHEHETDQNSQYLVGGSSLQSFMAYFTKQLINSEDYLPQKLASVGRNYVPVICTNNGLLECTQSNVVDAFVILQNNSSLEEDALNQLIMILTESYNDIALPFRFVQYSAHKLETYESAAVGIEIFSPFTREYHEVGRISTIGDFLSKRLWAIYKTKSGSTKFCSVFHIRVCHISKLIALVMENGQQKDGSYIIPNSFDSFMLFK